MQDFSVRKSLNVWLTSFVRTCKHDKRLAFGVFIALMVFAAVAVAGFAFAPSYNAVEIINNGSLDPDDSRIDGDSVPESKAVKDSLFVDVQGAVACSGVYELADGSRISDALDAAGGLADDANISGLNRAAALTDGQLVYVPHAGEANGIQEAESSASSTGQSSAGLISINNATAEQLDELPGVGPSTAQAIVDDRKQNGPFSTLEDLMRVSGIGEKKFEKLKGSITL